MNREIKFRAWNGITMNYNIVVGKFGAFWVNPGKGNNGLDENDSACLTPFNTKCLDSTIIMQFTGFVDSDGKEIYEGDLINSFQNDYKPTEVFWDDDLGQWGTQNYHSTLSLRDSMQNTIKVVGNIHENPELLK